MSYKQVKIYVGGKSYVLCVRAHTYGSTYQSVDLISDNCMRVPELFLDMITSHLNDEKLFCYPYLNYDTFCLFMNLLTTPDGLKVDNPYNKNTDDLLPIFELFQMDGYEKQQFKERL